MSDSKLLRGTIILTLATLISKVLGFIYVVPFTALVGPEGYILFEYAYKPYVIMLSIATMGVPLAVSKFVSKYNEIGDYKTTQKLFKSGLYIMFLTGLISFIILHFSSERISYWLIDENDTTGNSIEDVAYVIKMVSYALLLVPVMALIRGYFQGHQSMAPTAVSQVVEQLLRILLILGGSFVILYVMEGTVASAVGISTFGACFGAIGGLIVLLWYWKKRKPVNLDVQKKGKKKKKEPKELSYKAIYKEVFLYAVPFVIVGLSIPLYQTIDTFMINKALISIGFNLANAELVNSIVSLNQKVILIPVSLATAFSITLVPAITKANTAKNFKLMNAQISQTYRTVMYLTLPAVMGLMAIGEPVYASLFGSKHATLGGELMVWYAGTALFYSFYSVTAAILQGMDKQKYAITSLLIGLAFKTSLNYHFIMWYEGVGTVLTTYIGFGISILLNMWWIKRDAKYNFSFIRKDITIIALSSAVMFGIVLGLDHLIEQAIENNNYYEFILRTIVGCTLGGIVYLFFTIQYDLHKNIIGERFRFLNKLKLKKR